MSSRPRSTGRCCWGLSWWPWCWSCRRASSARWAGSSIADPGAAEMPLLLAQGLRKSFGETRAVDGVDFLVESEELVSLVGSNGAGKTTLVNLLSGLLVPDAGSIAFQDADITAEPVRDRIKAGIARSFQLVNLFDQLSALDNVRLAIFSRDGTTRQVLRLAERNRPARNEAMEILRD